MYQNITIYGPGAIGGWIAARLAATGRTVHAVARGQTLRALQHHGLRLLENAQEHAYEVRATDQPAELGPQDLVIVAVKGPAMESVAAGIVPLLGPDTVVLTAMNGVPWWFLHDFGGELAGRSLQSVDPGGRIAAAIDARHVMGAVVHASCSLDAPGVVRHNMGNRIIIGEPGRQTTARARALEQLLGDAGFAVELSEQIQKEIWYKLWGNMTMNPICAMTGATGDVLLDDDLVRAFMSRGMQEAREIGARIGIPIAEDPEARHAITRKLGRLKPSMLQDVEAGKPVEIDALVSAVRELGQLTDVPTPAIDTLLGLARVHARTLGLYPG